jgi:hypothetical protein
LTFQGKSLQDERMIIDPKEANKLYLEKILKTGIKSVIF